MISDTKYSKLKNPLFFYMLYNQWQCPSIKFENSFDT